MVTLVRQARRRLLYNTLLSEGATAANATLLIFILLLLVGTQVLSWQWTIIVPVIAIAAGVYRTRKRLPSTYSVAQIIDGRLGLADSISTALYFQEFGRSSNTSEEMRALQLSSAEKIAETADVRKAVPFSMPKTAYAAVALMLVASSLFALRYGLSRRLDLKQPLAQMLQLTTNAQPRTEQAKKSKQMQQPEQQWQQDENTASAPDEGQRAGDQEMDSANANEEKNDGGNQGDSKATAMDPKKAPSEEGEKAEGEQSNGQGDDQAEGGESGSGQQGAPKQDQKDGNGRQDANNSENSSIMSKFKDAVQNLLSRVKPQQGQQGQQQQQAMDQKGNQGKSQQQGKQQSKEGQPQNGGQQGDAQEGQSSEQAQNAQDPQGKGQGKSEAQQPSKQPGNGVGSQDGDKSIRQAEQLAAMGKISEILGKRSATITGEATVEVQQTSQQLHTPYAQRGNQHTQGGAEINRDEIPAALQTYVEQYFEQVRKQPGAAAAAKKK